jgi:hypothetical protein
MMHATAAALTTSTQQVQVQGINATTKVFPSGADLEIQTTFESAVYPVGCLSAYRDLRYELKDSANRVIPLNSHTLQNPPYDGPRMLEPVVANAKPRDCSYNAPAGKWYTEAFLSALYPNLQPGRYTLSITFAPRSKPQSVTLKTITLNLDTSHHFSLDARP